FPTAPLLPQQPGTPSTLLLSQPTRDPRTALQRLQPLSTPPPMLPSCQGNSALRPSRHETPPLSSCGTQTRPLPSSSSSRHGMAHLSSCGTRTRPLPPRNPHHCELTRPTPSGTPPLEKP
ncbi:hypothetical protein G0U57_018324, partial [Chelydra serpentina]